MTHMQRRQFLKQTGAAAGGLVTLGGFAGSAAAYGVPLISTREHFDDSGNLVSGETATSYDTSGTVPGVDTGCAGDLTVFMHGWDKNNDNPEQAARDKIATAQSELTGAGYGGTVVGYTWDSDAGGGIDFGWGTAKTVAQKNGQKLAQFLLDYKLACPNATVRLVSHSLGAQVLFSSLRNLDADSTWNSYGFRVDSAHPLGAATDNEIPTAESPDSYAAIRDQTGATFNYYSGEDNVLQWVYNTIEFDQALGETGAEDGNTVPGNYSDFDGTSQVGDDHSGYLTNLSDEIVADMASL